MIRYLAYSMLFFTLGACAPILEVLEEDSSSQAQALWTAQVSRVERYAGQYQGEQGSATVQDGQVLELELSNRAFGGSARFSDGSLDSPPMRVSYSGGGFFEGQATATFAGAGISEYVFFIGEAEPNLVVENGLVTGSLRFTGSDDVGQVMDVVVENIRVPY